jgi:PAS domain S-box-containing protein
MTAYSRHRNLNTVSIILVLLIFFLTAGAIIALSLETESVIRDGVHSRVIAIANLTSLQIKGESLAALKPGDEKTVDFLQIRDHIRRVKEADPDITAIRTMRKTGESIEIVVDGDWGFIPDAAPVGRVWADVRPELTAGFSAPSSDREFRAGRQGTILTGYSPVLNESMMVAGIVCVDLNTTAVNDKLRNLTLIYYLIGFVLLFFSVLGIIVNERRRISADRKVRESEEKYRFLFEEAGDAIFLIDTDDEGGIIVEANRAAEKMHGYSADELKGRDITDLATSDAIIQVKKAFHEILRGNVMFGELILTKKDGTVFPVEVSAGLVDLGRKKYIIAVSRDISEKKLAEMAIARANKKLNVLNYITFTNIQNAIYALSGYLEIGKGMSDNASFAGFITKEEELVLRIIRYLDFARCYQDMGAKPPAWQNVAQALIFAISHMDFSSVIRDINIEGIEIYADPLLEQVFTALSENVLRHGEKATRLMASYVERDDGLHLVFGDNGVGIPRENKEVIFTRGYGTQKGMGLFLVREILSITDITISETGIPGEGARFQIIVPKGSYRFIQNTGPDSSHDSD